MRSSFHFISGDHRLSPLEKFFYRASCRLEHLLDVLPGRELSIMTYAPSFDRDRFVTAFGEEALDLSPARVLCFDFLLQKGGAVFGPDKAVADLGCGRGNYAQHIAGAHGYRHYHGYDMEPRPSWPLLTNSNTEFSVARLGKDTIDVADIDTIFSQSVLEHVANDKAALRRVSAAPRMLMHLHLVPARRSFRVYGFHGYRRYGMRELSRLLDLPGIDLLEIYMFGNKLTRDLAIEYYQVKSGKNGRGSAGHTKLYDTNERTFGSLAALGEDIHPNSHRDADFFAILFRQKLSA